MSIPASAAATRKPVEAVGASATVDHDYFGSTVVATAAGAETLTIPVDLFDGLEDEADGLSFDVIQGGAGAFTIAAAGGVTLTNNGGVATSGAGTILTVRCLGPNAYHVQKDAV
jgi:hypothetical protein